MPLALTLALVAVAVGHRLLLEQHGRQTNVLALDDNEKIVRPWQVEDFRQAGRLTVLEGSEIHDVFRAQLPVNPRLYTVANLIRIHSDHTYLITNERGLYRRLKENLPGLRTYQSGNLVFNGVRIPKAFILYSDMDKSTLKDRTLGFPGPEVLQQPDKYLYLAEIDLGTVLRVRPENGIQSNVILKSDRLLHHGRFSEALLEGPGKIYVLGKNATLTDPTTSLDSEKLLLTHNHRTSKWFRGSVAPPGEGFFAYGLPILLAGIGFLGLFLQGYPIRWAAWLLIGIGVYLFFPGWHLLLTGLLAAGLVRLGLRLRGTMAGWFVLAGLVVFGFGYKPYEMVPFQGHYAFWIGALVGLLVVSPGWRNRLRNDVTFSDLIVGVVGLGVVSLAAPWGLYPGAGAAQLALATVALPLVPLFLGSQDYIFRGVWIVGLAAWCLFFLGNVSLYAPFFFVSVMLAWAGFRFLGQWNTRRMAR